jgi:hypothetical protein
VGAGHVPLSMHRTALNMSNLLTFKPASCAELPREGVTLRSAHISELILIGVNLSIFRMGSGKRAVFLSMSLLGV